MGFAIADYRMDAGYPVIRYPSASRPAHTIRPNQAVAPLFCRRVIRTAYTFQKLDKLCEFGLYPPPQSS